MRARYRGSCSLIAIKFSYSERTFASNPIEARQEFAMQSRYLVVLALLALSSLRCAPPSTPPGLTAESFEIARVRFDPGRRGLGAGLQGQIQNHTDWALEMVQIYAVITDQFGTVLDRPFDTVVRMEPGERAEFKVPISLGLEHDGETFSWRLTHISVLGNDGFHEIELSSPEQYGVINP